MFPVRMFCNRMFAPRMFPKVGADAVSVTTTRYLWRHGGTGRLYRLTTQV